MRVRVDAFYYFPNNKTKLNADKPNETKIIITKIKKRVFEDRLLKKNAYIKIFQNLPTLPLI